MGSRLQEDRNHEHAQGIGHTSHRDERGYGDGSQIRPMSSYIQEATHASNAARKEEASRRRKSDYLTGIGLLLLVVLLWTGSNFLTNHLLTSGWDKPFAVTYANTSSFSLYLIPFALAWRASKKRHGGRGRGGVESHRNGSGTSTPEGFWAKFGFSLPEVAGRDTPRVQSQSRRGSYTPLAVDEGGGVASYDSTRLAPGSSEIDFSSAIRHPRLLQHSGRPSSIDGRRPASSLPHYEDDEQRNNFEADALPPLTFRETAVLAAQFTLVWFAANWSLNAGLGMTSVASGTTLSSASGFFTLALGSLTGVEQFTRTKFLAVVISFVGVVLVTHADSSNADQGPGDSLPSNARLGDFLSLLSAFFYAVYVTLLKLRIKSEDRVSMPLFFGFVGAFNILCMWPVGVGLDLTGVEPFQWPVDRRTWIGVGVNMLITFVSDFSYLLSMLKTAPLIATVGLSLTIPLAVLIDLLRGTHSGGWMANVGSAAVLFSFVAVGLDDNKYEDEAMMEPDENRRIARADVERGRSATASQRQGGQSREHSGAYRD